LTDAALELGRVLPRLDRVHVDDAVDAVVALLQRDELDDRAEIVAEMQVTGRLHAGKDPFLEGHCVGSLPQLELRVVLRGVPMPRRPRATQGRRHPRCQRGRARYSAPPSERIPFLLNRNTL